MGIFTSYQDPSRNETVAVGTSSVVISNARQTDLNKRKVISVRNMSPNAADIITVNLGNGAAVADNGIVLKQYESFTDSNDGDAENDKGYLCWQGSVTAICATATGTVSIFER